MTGRSREEESAYHFEWGPPSAEARSLHGADDDGRDDDVSSSVLTETVHSIALQRMNDTELTTDGLAQARRSPEERLRHDLEEMGAAALISRLVGLRMDELRVAADGYNCAVPLIASEQKLAEIVTTTILAAANTPMASAATTTTTTRTSSRAPGSEHRVDDLKSAFAKAFKSKIKLPMQKFDGDSNKLFPWLQSLEKYQELYPVDAGMLLTHVLMFCLEGKARKRVDFALSKIKTMRALSAFLICNFGGEGLLIRERHRLVSGGLRQGDDMPEAYRSNLETAVAEWGCQVKLLKEARICGRATTSVAPLSESEWIAALCRGMNAETRAEVDKLTPADDWHSHVVALRGAENVLQYRARTAASGRGGGRVQAATSQHTAKHGTTDGAQMYALKVDNGRVRVDDGRRPGRGGFHRRYGGHSRGSGGASRGDWQPRERKYCNVCDAPNPGAQHTDLGCPKTWHKMHGVDTREGGCVRCGDGVRGNWKGKMHRANGCPLKWERIQRRRVENGQRQGGAPPVAGSSQGSTAGSPTPTGGSGLPGADDPTVLRLRKEVTALRQQMASMQADFEVIGGDSVDEKGGASINALNADCVHIDKQLFTLGMDLPDSGPEYIDLKTKECGAMRPMADFGANLNAVDTQKAAELLAPLSSGVCETILKSRKTTVTIATPKGPMPLKNYLLVRVKDKRLRQLEQWQMFWIVSGTIPGGCLIGRPLLRALGYRITRGGDEVTHQRGSGRNQFDDLDEHAFGLFAVSNDTGTMETVEAFSAEDAVSEFEAKKSATDTVTESALSDELQAIVDEVAAAMKWDSSDAIEEGMVQLASKVKAQTLGGAARARSRDELKKRRQQYSSVLSATLHALVSQNQDLAAQSQYDTGRIPGVELHLRVKPGVPVPSAKAQALTLDDSIVVGDYLIAVLTRVQWEVDPGNDYSGVSRFLVVRMTGKKPRVCVDLRGQNARLVVDCFPTPDVREVIEKLALGVWFSSIDLKCAYHSIVVAKDSRKYFAVVCIFGTFRSCVMVFGVKVGPAFWMRTILALVGPLPDTHCFFDDVVQSTATAMKAIVALAPLFFICLENNLKLSIKKCVFLVLVIVFVGRLVSAGRVAPCHDHIGRILEVNKPQDAEELRRTLGVCQWLAQFIPHLAEITVHFGDLLKKRAPWIWTEIHEEAWSVLLKAVAAAGPLALPDFSKRFYVRCDASHYAMGGILLQKDAKDRLVPIAFYSKQFPATQRKWPPNRKELESVCRVTLAWRRYLLPRVFSLDTDHKPLLEAVAGQTDSVLARRSIVMSEYCMDLGYIPGIDNDRADYASRVKVSPRFDLDEARDVAADCFAMQCFGAEEWKETTRHSVRQVMAQSAAGQLPSGGNAHSERCAEDSLVASDFSQPSDDLSEDGDSEPQFRSLDIAAWGRLQQMDLDLCRVRRLETGEENGGNDEWFYDQSLAKAYTGGELVLDSGCVVRRKDGSPACVVVPHVFRRALIEEMHAATEVGVTKTAEQLTAGFWWPKMKTEVEHFVAQCSACKAAKGVRGSAPKTVCLANDWNEVVHTDLSELPLSSDGYRYLLVATDKFTALTTMAPLRESDALTVAKSLRKDWFLVYGAPRLVVSDNGQQFVGKVMEVLRSAYGTGSKTTSAYRPQFNGAAERRFGFMKPLLKAQAKARGVDLEGSNWHEWLPGIVSAHNTTKQASTGQTPHKMVFGREFAHGELDWDLRRVRNKLRSELSGTRKEAAASFVQEMGLSLKALKKDARQRQESRADRRVAQEFAAKRQSTFEVGAVVWKGKSALRLKLSGIGVPKADGPYKVVKQVNASTYLLADVRTGARSVANASELKHTKVLL